MFILSYLGESQQFDLTTGLNLLIVRKPPEKIPPHFIHVPQLSPSQDLFNTTQGWKRQFEKKEDWWHLYVERFTKEIETRNDLKRALKRLELREKEGMDIRLFCFCKDVEHCHRYFIGKELERRGYQVDYRKKERIEQMSLFD